MQEKTVTITPNKRLSRHLQRRFCETLALKNLETWPTQKIVPLTTWLINCWQEVPDPRVLLNPLQEKAIWQQIICETLGESHNNLPELAIDFHKITNEWQIKNIDNLTKVTDDIMIFQPLYKIFQKYCKHKNLVTISELPTLLIPHTREFKLSQIILTGFDEYHPQLLSLMAAFEKIGCRVLKEDPNNEYNSNQIRIGFANLNEELITAAEWAKKVIKNTPKTSIGIIVPNLIELRSKVTQVFTEVLDDVKQLNISAGTPLNTLPIINAALEFLSLTEPVNLETATKILLSPYLIGAKNERSGRMLLNHQLSELDCFEFKIDDLKQEVKKNDLQIPLLIEALVAWQELLQQRLGSLLPCSEWSQIFVKILQVLGWPGNENLTTIEAAAVQDLINSFSNLAALDPLLEKISYQKALKICREFISSSILQAEPESAAPINIIGTLEAAGINFDHLWVMGVDEEHWPSAPKPNPFIPLPLQRKLSLPHSSAERELEFCETLINRYKRSAKESFFSYVTQAEDRQIAPSSLIENIPEISAADLNLRKSPSSTEKIYYTQKLESLTSDQAPKLRDDELIHAPSRLLESQSQCPFRAFMEFRLKTKESKKPSLGISKINRGILLHNALEHFWQKIKTKQNLDKLDSRELQNEIANSIEQALGKLTLPKALSRLEAQCLNSLLSGWLEIEKGRAPFKVVATEKKVEVILATIPIKLRIDRIDELENGKNLLLDYKTGKNLPVIFDWFGSRPKNLQLLLYSLAVDQIEGIALGQINSESLRLKNFSLEELAFALRTLDPEKNISQGINWPDLLNYWREVLTKIGEEFKLGTATVTPTSPQVCMQCEFGPACRYSGEQIV